VDANSIAALAGLPAEMNVSLLVYDPENNTVEMKKATSLQTILTLPGQANRAVFSPDGKSIAYADETGMQIVNVETQEVTSIPNAVGANIAWSPDGSQLAFVSGGEGIYVVGAADGQPARRVSALANEAIAGWSPDGAALYLDQPDLSGGSWMLRKVDINTGAAENLFVLENASRKAPFAALSPDGRWLAYRDSELNSLLLADMSAAGAANVLADLSGHPEYIAITNISWSGKWLAIGLAGRDGDFDALLVDPSTCQSYRLDGVGGYLLGIVIGGQ
jgi:Tol biopolymer transport system component